MSQVTRRGLVQASFSCALLAAAVSPLSLAPALPPPMLPDPNWLAKLKLARYIAKTFSRPMDLTYRIVDASFRNALKAKLSPLLVLAVIAKESSFTPTARSDYGAVGLMQVVPRMHEDLVARIVEPEGLEHPESNIDTGTTILAGYMRSKGGDVQATLRKYSGNARQYGERVLAYWQEFAQVAYPGKQLA